jgi:hypothetical protein
MFLHDLNSMLREVIGLEIYIPLTAENCIGKFKVNNISTDFLRGNKAIKVTIALDDVIPADPSADPSEIRVRLKPSLVYSLEALSKEVYLSFRDAHTALINAKTEELRKAVSMEG